MATSNRWRNLSREIDSLRTHFLPRKFDPLGVYGQPRKVQGRTRAFLVLSHAELESYFEEWAKELARRAEERWRKSGKVTVPVAGLLATLAEPVGVSQAIPVPREKQLSNVVTTVFQAFYRHIKNNHGIKEANVLSLFLPLGLPQTAWGATLLADLNSFGESRGEHAHHAARAIVTPLDPETEYKRVKALVTDVKTFDQELVTFKNSLH